MFDHKEMSEEKKEKLTAKLKEMGIDESVIDEKLMWSVKKVSFSLMKLRLVLDDKGVDEEKIREIIDKLVDKAKAKDLAEVREWHEKHKQEKQDV
ncbi:MAG: hypothetical protein ACHQT9_01245 [Candidatus Saccharimonadales bacterium]